MTTGWTPDLVRTLSGEDYANLIALYNVDPWGPERDNLHAAMILSQTANLHRRKTAPPVSIQRFMLGRNTSTQTEAQRIQALRTHIKQSIEKDQHGGNS